MLQAQAQGELLLVGVEVEVGLELITPSPCPTLTADSYSEYARLEEGTSPLIFALDYLY